MRRQSWALICTALLLVVLLLILAGCGSETPGSSTSIPSSVSVTSKPGTSQTTSSPSSSTAFESLKIGLANDLTGFLSTWMLAENRTVQLAAELINESGGITVGGKNYEVTLVTADTASSVEGAAAAANKLVYDEGVKFMLGGIAFENAAISQVTEPNKVLRIIFDATPDPSVVGPSKPYSFVSLGSTVEHLIALAHVMKKEFPAIKNVLLVTNDDGQQSVTVPFMVRILEDLGYAVANGKQAIVFPMQMEDFTPIANQINSLKADGVIFMNVMMQAATGITKALRALGNEAPIVGKQYPADIDGFISAIGSAGATNYVTLAQLRGDPNSPPAFKALEAKLAPGEPVAFNQAAALDYLLKAVQKADSLDVDSVKEAMESMQPTEGVYGLTTPCGEQTFGIRHALSASIQYVKLMEGKVAPVENDWITYPPIP